MIGTLIRMSQRRKQSPTQHPSCAMPPSHRLRPKAKVGPHVVASALRRHTPLKSGMLRFSNGLCTLMVKIRSFWTCAVAQATTPKRNRADCWIGWRLRGLYMLKGLCLTMRLQPQPDNTSPRPSLKNSWGGAMIGSRTQPDAMPSWTLTIRTSGT